MSNRNRRDGGDRDNRTWRVRDISDKSTEELEDILNGLDSRGYDVYDIDYNVGRVVARRVMVEPPQEEGDQLPGPIGAILNAIRGKGNLVQVDLGGMPDNSGDPKGKHTLQLVSGLNGVLLRHHDNTPEMYKHIERVIQLVFSGAEASETAKTKEDLTWLLNEHQCRNPNCSTRVALEHTLKLLGDRVDRPQAHAN